MRSLALSILWLCSSIADAQALEFSYFERRGGAFEIYAQADSQGADPDLRTYHFRFRDVESAWKSGIIRSQIATIEDARLVGQKALVIGSTGKSTIISVIDLSSMKEIDRIRCYDASFSPSGRYIAYKKFYPRNSTLPETLLVYESDQDPDGNRHANQPTLSSESLAEDPYIASVDVGYPIFPTPGNYSQSNSVNDETSEFIGIGSRVWSSTENEIAFIRTLRSIGESRPSDISVVRFDLRNGVGHASLKVTSIFELLPDVSHEQLGAGAGQISYQTNGHILFSGGRPTVAVEIP